MIRRMTLCPVLAGLLIFCPPVMAQWSGSVGVGVINASGNSRSSSANALIELEKASATWTHQFQSELYRARSDGDEEADRFALAYKARRAIGDSWYGWGSLRAEQDQFANIDRRFAAVLGAGRHLLTGPVHSLDAEAGLGWRKTVLLGEAADSTAAIGTLGLSYEGVLSETVRITQKLSAESGKDNTLLLSTSGLRVVISDRLSLVLKHAIRRNSDILGDLGKKTDSLSTVTVAYEF
ncbi:MAG: DUF481 domain-containing protein [Burkholderiaceae bacterium]